MKMTIAGRTVRADVYRNEELAREVAGRSFNRRMILGDEGQFWVCTHRDAEIFVKSGYQES